VERAAASEARGSRRAGCRSRDRLECRRTGILRPIALHPRSPILLSQRLRATLGDEYVAIGTEARALGYYLEEQDPVNQESLGSALGELGRGWLLIDLDAAAREPALGAWLREPWLVRYHWGYQRVRPAVAADFLVYADSLSPTGGEIH
jgi:hypothetical protein